MDNSEDFFVWSKHKIWVGINRKWEVIGRGKLDWCIGFVSACKSLAPGFYKILDKNGNLQPEEVDRQINEKGEYIDG